MKHNLRKIGVVLSYISMFLTIFISLIYTPIQIRMLGQEEYGLYKLVLSMISYLSILELGFNSAYFRYYSKFKITGTSDEIERLNGMFLAIFGILGGTILLAGGVLITQMAVFFGDSLTTQELSKSYWMMIILVVNLAFSFPFQIFSTYITANERQFYLKILDILTTTLRPFLAVSLLFMGHGALGLIWLSAFLNISKQLLYMVYAKRKLQMKFQFKQLDKSLFLEVTVFTSFFSLSLVANQINWNVDNFLLGVYQGTAMVAVYSVAAQLKNYYIQFSNSIEIIFTPQAHQLVAKGGTRDEISHLVARIGRIQFCVLSLILGGLILLGDPFILWWAGEEYHETYLVLLIMILPATISSVQGLCEQIQTAKGLFRFPTTMQFLIAIGNLIISIPLAQMYGAVGCASGTALATIFGEGIILNIYRHKKVGINMLYFWKEMALLSRGFVLPAVVGVWMAASLDLYQPVLFLLCGMVYTLVFIGSVWLFGFNEYEKNLALSAWKSAKRKLKMG